MKTTVLLVGILGMAAMACAEDPVYPVKVSPNGRYFVDQDILGQWLEDYCIIDPKRVATSEALYMSWSMYAAQRGEEVGTRNRGFPSTLQARGFEPIRDKFGIRGRGFRGLSLKSMDSEL
jgi:hypothetical protein